MLPLEEEKREDKKGRKGFRGGSTKGGELGERGREKEMKTYL